MFNNVATQSNLDILSQRGVYILDSDSGILACGDEGKGRLPDAEVIYNYINDILYPQTDLKGKNVLITCGATIEKLDDVRFITNFSSGKMGCAIAKEAQSRGANVTLVLARHSVPVPQGVNVVNVETTQQMHDAVMQHFDSSDAFIMAAAPCDYRPETFSNSKIKTESLSLNFVKNVDIAASVGAKKGSKVLVAFSAETDNEIANATNKLQKKNADFIVCNNVKSNDVFASDTNVVSIIDKSGVTSYDKMSKDAVAGLILDKLTQIL
jgi:phosphopantothenoylcysteine decarboxylase/phosphopantothenate--cysteine ligase